MKIIYKIIFVFFITTVLSSQTIDYITINGRELIKLTALVEYKSIEGILTIQSSEKRLVFTINSNTIEPVLKTQPQKIKIDNFPISPTELRNIYLEKAENPVDENTVWMRNTKEGIKKGESPKFDFYCGKIEGEEKSKVYFGYSGEKLFCIIERGNGDKYFINPIPNKIDSKYPHLLVASSYTYENSNLMPFICFTKDYMNIPSEKEIRNKAKNGILEDKMLQLEIALEASNDYFQMHANYEQASAYMTAVMAIVSKIYFDQLNVKIHIPFVYIWEDSTKDPYANKNDVTQKLWSMPKVWKSRSNVNRTIACLFAGLHVDGNGYYTAGVSMGINTLCDKGNGYCVFGIKGSTALPTMNYVSDVSVTAHEIGHACGGPHTHSCYFEPNMIDTCITAHLPNESDGCVEDGVPIPRPGTIMSYCHLTNSTRSVQYIFGERMLPILRSALDDANCINEVQQPLISLLNPSGDKALKSGNKEEIIWTSTLINLVSIKYSSDNGKTWDVIASGKPASDKSFIWTVPNINSEKVIIIIFDTGNSEIADTVLKPFSIHTPLLSINGPTNGQRFGQREKYYITWESVFVDSVQIFLSTNGGTNWTRIVSKATGNLYEWQIPEIVSTNCRLKVESLTEDKLISESEMFAIGVSNVKILSPNGSEKLCIGNDFEIRWESDYLNNLWLEYSVDKGKVWRKVSLGIIDALPGNYIWKVPNRISDSCIIRIYPQFDKNLIFDTSDSVFTIDSCQTGIEDNFNNSGFKILDVKPNPINDEADVTIMNNINSANISLIMFDDAGRMVHSFGNFNSNGNDKINIKIKLPELAQGNYFIKACSGEYCDSYKITIIR